MSFTEILQGIAVKDGETTGYTGTVEEAYTALRSFESTTNSKYVCIKKPGAFGKKGTFVEYYVMCYFGI